MLAGSRSPPRSALEEPRTSAEFQVSMFARTPSTRAITPPTTSIILLRQASISIRNCFISRSHVSQRLSRSLMRHRLSHFVQKMLNSPRKFSGEPLIAIAHDRHNSVGHMVDVRPDDRRRIHSRWAGNPSGTSRSRFAGRCRRLPGASDQIAIQDPDITGLSRRARNNPPFGDRVTSSCVLLLLP